MAASLHRVYQVVRVVREADAGVTLVFDNSLPARPGQFVMSWLPGVEERPFTVVNDSPLMLTVAQVGPLTHALCALAPGDALWIRGPYGHGFEVTGRQPLLVGGGSGTASLSLLAQVLRDRGQEVTVALGARNSRLTMLGWRFQELGCRLMLASDDGSIGTRGSVVDAVSSLVCGLAVDAVYACGPEPMLRALVRLVDRVEREHDIRIPCQVSLEAVMKCGLGLCGNCHHGDKLVCKDGPVFDGSQVWLP